MRRRADLRRTRSRKHLSDALIRLLEKQNVEDISVCDLVEAAQVSRSAFYAQFEDKADFLRQTVEDMLAGLRRQNRLAQAEATGGSDEEAGRKIYTAHFRYIAAHADFFRVMLGRRGSAEFFRKMEESVSLTYQNILGDVADDRLPTPRAFLVQYVVSAHIGLTRLWLENGMKYSCEYMARMILEWTLERLLRPPAALFAAGNAAGKIAFIQDADEVKGRWSKSF